MSTDVTVVEDLPVRRFNPNDHIMQIPNKGGKSDYLPVQWRLVWFRELCPQGTIETQEIMVDIATEFEGEAYVWNQEKKRSEKIIKRAPGYARFRAIVHDGKGGFATATKTEKGVDFAEFVEKAETGAVGRALAMLGYGTQFAEVELSEDERIVDAPVERKPTRSYQERKPFVESSVTVKEEPNMATEQQLASIRKLLQHLGKPEPVDQDKMTYLDAKATIVALSNEYRETREQKPVLQTVPAQPQAQDAHPETPVENMTQLINRCRYRATKYGYKTIAQYEQYCQEVIGKPSPETLADVGKLNADLSSHRLKA